MNSLLQLFPSILASIIAVDQMVKGAKKGTTKKQLVMDAVKLGTGIAGEVGSSLGNSQIQAISVLIDKTVETLNNAGVFEAAKSKEVVADV